uniref:Synaptotagmin-like protein 2 n=2 Tax=Xenopus tropicalis TaxID=8364 RepID=A0A6I8R8Y0_XENTR
MIDLSFLTEAEQEAILRVLNRDAELKKAEEERVRHLYDAVDDENELKYKSGQWFYEAKSKRHRDKIHGADLVRASMRKRKAPPATLAELSRNYKENSKKSWVSSVNKDVFIPPELYGVMEDQEEEQGGFVPVKIEPTQSSKRVSFLSTDKNMESSKNGNVSPSRQRRNPFNSTNEGDDDTELGKDTHEPVNGPESGDKVSYPDVLPPKIKFGVKLPYPAPGEIIRLSSTSPNASLTNGGQIPIPKPRTMPLKKTDSLERSSSDLKREDSFGSSGRPKSILKRRSSSSSTDSESIRLAQKADLNKIGLSTPILQAEPVDESPDKLKQVRFSANVHQNPPSPGGESVGGKEIGEFGILEPGLSQASLENRASSEDSVSAPKPSSSLVLDILTKTIYRKGSGEIPDLNGSPVEGPSLGANSASLNEDLNNIKEDSFVQENKPEVSLALEANVSSDNDPLYAAVKKPSGSFSSGLSQDYDMEDAHKFLGQGWKMQNRDRGGQKLVFGTSSGGIGKMSFERDDLSNIPQLENVLSFEENKENEGDYLDAEENDMPDMESEPADEPTDYFPAWRRPSIIINESLRQPITADNLSKERTDAPQTGHGKFRQPSQESGIQTDSAYSSEDLKVESRYTPLSIRDAQRVEEDKPDGLMTNLYSESKPNAVEGTADKANVRFLDQGVEGTGLPIPSKFETMYFRDRFSDGPKEQMLNSAQRPIWNTEEKNNLKLNADVPSSTLLKDTLYSKKPLHVDPQLKSSSEISPESLLPQNNYEILSEEELTSQKVASWLAQTPSIQGEEQIDLIEEHLYPEEQQMYPAEEQIYAKEEQVNQSEEVGEVVERSTVNHKSGAEEFKNALEKLKEEMSQAPPIAEMQNVSYEQPNRGSVVIEADSKATEPFPYAVDKNQDRAPTAYRSLPNSSFFQRVMQISQSINKEASPDEVQMTDQQKSPLPEPINLTNNLKQEEVINDLTPLPMKAQTDYASPYDKNDVEEIRSLDSQEVREEEVVQEKVTAVKDAFRISLQKLEEEYNIALASEAQMTPSFEEGGEEGQVQESPSPTVEQSEEEVVPEKVPVVKDAFKVALERLSEEHNSAMASDAQITLSSGEVNEGYLFQESPSPTVEQSEEEVVPEKVPVVKDAFKVALERLAEEHNSAMASDAQIIPSFDEGYLLQESPSPAIEQSEEEVVPEKVPVVKDAFKVALERLVEEHNSAMASDAQITPSSEEVNEGHQLQECSSPTIDQSKEYANEVEEVVEKMSVPDKSYQDEFTAALNKLQVEASEPAYTTEISEPANAHIDFNTEISSVHENRPDEVKTNLSSPVSQSIPYETVENTNVRLTSPDKGRVERPHSGNFRVMTLKERISDGNEEQISNPEQFRNLRKFWDTEKRSSKELDGYSKLNAQLKTKDNLKDNLSDTSSTKTASTLNDLQERDENVYKDISSRESSSVDGASAAVIGDIIGKDAASLDLHQHTDEEEIGAREWNWEEPESQDNPTFISNMPSRDVVISKKVYSTIESLPSYKDKENNLDRLTEPQEQGSTTQRKPQDLYFAARYEVLDKNSGSDQSGSVTESSGNLLYKKPESESPDASKRNSIDPKQGKPPVVGIPGNPDPLNPDKHTIEIMKAQDESISKVLDWLNRSSESGDDEPNMSENKPVNSEKPVPIYTDKCGEGNNVPQEMLVSGNTMPALLQQKPPSYIQPVSDVISPPSNEVDRAGVEGNVELTTFENLEDLQQATDSFQNSMGPTAEPLVFGTSKGGIGKIHNHVHFAEDMENQQKEDALSPARLPSPVQNDFLPIDENGVQETLVPENLESILIQGQAEANTQSEFLHENSIGVLENVESPSHINTNLPEASTDFGVPKQSSEVGEPLVFGYSRGGIGKMRNPVVNELGNVAIDNTNNLDSANTKDQVTPIVREEETKIPENFLTQGSDPILQEQPIVEGLSGSSPYQSETENNYDEPGVETNADFWTQAAIKYVPGTINEVTEGSLNLGEGKHSTIEFGEKETAELPQNAENMDSEDTDNQADEVTLANPQSLGQCESNQESGTKISDFEPKSINEVKQFWEKGEKERNTQSEMKKSTQKDVAALGSQIHVKESIAAFSQKSSSFESDDGNSGLVTFKKVILDEESLPSIAQLKTFWEQERNKLENLECRPKNELIENGTGQCEVRPTFATPPLNFDRMEKRKKNRKRHTFHCFFEGDQDSVSKQDYLTRGVSLHDGALGVDKKYNSSTFQSLRSFWDAGKNIQDDPMLPAVEKNLEPPTIQAATTTNLQNGPDTTFQEKGRQISNLSDEELSLSDSNNTVKSETEINMENPNIQTSSSQEPVSETVVKTVAPSKAATELQKEITDADLDFGSEVKPICDSTSQNTMIDHLPLESKETEMRDQDTPENPDQDRFEHSQSNVVEESDTICNMPTSEIFTSTEEPVEEGLNSPISFPNSDLYSYHTRPQEQSNEYPKTNTLELIPNNITGYDENRTSILETDLMANNTSLKEDTSYQTESSTAASDESAYATQEEFLSSSERVPPDGRSFDNELENSSNALEKLNERDLPEEVYEGLEKTSLERNNDLETNLEKLARESVPPAEGQQFPSSDPEIVSSDSSQPPMSLIFNDSVQGNLAMPEKQSKKEIIEKIKNPDIRSRPFYTNFDTGLAKLYRESLDLDPSGLEASDQNPVSVENNMEVQNPNEFVHMSLSAQSSAFINDPELHDSDHATPEESISSDSMYSDALSEVVDSVKRTAVQRRELFANDFQISQEVVSDAEDLMGGSQSKVFIQTASIKLQMNRYNRNMSEQGVSADSSSTEGETPTQDSSVPQDDHREVGERRELVEDDDPADPLLQHVTQSTPLKERNSSLRRSTLQLYLEAPYRRDLSKSIDFELTGYLAPEAGHQKYQDDITVPKEDRDHTYEEVRADKVVPERSHFSDPEKLKRLSQSVPSFLNDDTDGRETDSASESSFQLGRHKKSPSSLTNLSGSSGMASLSSVSGSVMSIYSGDFGNVDIKGNIQFALDYADNLQEFQVFVSQCKDLAAADVKKQRSDPYVKAYLLPEKAKMGKRKTGVKKKTLNPVYNDVLRYKISKNALLSQTLNLSVWHHDVLGRNSFLGEVDVNLASWDWSNKQMNWYPLQPRTPAAGIGLENRGEMKLALKYVPEAFTGAKNAGTGEVHIWLKECTNLPMLRGNKINSFIKCTILPDTSRKSRQKTRAVDKTPNPYFNHTMVYDGFRKEDLKEACVELTVWDHNKLTNHFLGGLRIGLGTGKSYGTPVDWMDSNAAEATTWEKMITSPDTWVEAILPLRMLKMAKMAK